MLRITIIWACRASCQATTRKIFPTIKNQPVCVNREKGINLSMILWLLMGLIYQHYRNPSKSSCSKSNSAWSNNNSKGQRILIISYLSNLINQSARSVSLKNSSATTENKIMNLKELSPSSSKRSNTRKCIKRKWKLTWIQRKKIKSNNLKRKKAGQETKAISKTPTPKTETDTWAVAMDDQLSVLEVEISNNF